MEIIARQTPLVMTVEAVICQSVRTSVRSDTGTLDTREAGQHTSCSIIYLQRYLLVNSKVLFRKKSFQLTTQRNTVMMTS